MGKTTISMAIFNSKLLVRQRVGEKFSHGPADFSHWLAVCQVRQEAVNLGEP